MAHIEQAIQRLTFLCDTIPQLLAEIDEQAFSLREKPGKWSRKEIIGHLIDSAANNHHRFVRGQYEDVPTIVYDQDQWNTCNYYNQMDGRQIIYFWTAYNNHLLELIKLIPKDMLKREVDSGDANHRSIAYLINDYVVHLEHH
jgi:hypothetical protein